MNMQESYNKYFYEQIWVNFIINLAIICKLYNFLQYYFFILYQFPKVLMLLNRHFYIHIIIQNVQQHNHFLMYLLLILNYSSF